MAYDTNWDKVSLLMHFDGADNSTVFMNEVRRQLATVNGDAKISTAQSKFGGSSAYFDGTNSSISFSDSDLWFLNGDFTIEFWIYPTNVTPSQAFGILTQSSGANYEFTVALSDTGHIYIKRESGASRPQCHIYSRTLYQHLDAYCNCESR